MSSLKRLRLITTTSVLCGVIAAISAHGAKDTPAPVPVGESASKVTVPEGFNVNLFAGEPDVVQPIAFTWDHRGRMWVAECRTYPHWVQDDKKPGTDSIIILEDTNQDGKFDKKTVFADKLRNVSAIEVGFGGVWIGAVPYVQFIPDRNGDDVPDGPAETLLDGWNIKEVKHNIFSSFTWGPDGWLYATNGIQSKSRVGKPGTPEDKRVKFDCGVWRYHPTRHVFEVVAVGTTNPWGLDFDEFGECFITNCVIAHLWHVIPGAHYDRMYGQHFNPYHYGNIKTCADHLHWETGKTWTDSRSGDGKTGEAGGGHAHIGAMIYQGDNWPAEYRNSIFTANLHGNRLNRDILKPKGSGYVGTHGKDFAFWNDPWFRGLAVKQGPDGAVYISDWSDTGECHNYNVAQISNGRIYRIAYGTPKASQRDYSKLSEKDLIQTILTQTDIWPVRMAQLALQERAARTSIDLGAVVQPLMNAMRSGDARISLRAMWTLHRTGALSVESMEALLANDHAEVRGWAIRLAVDEKRPTDGILARFAKLAATDPSPVVRLKLASALQRLPVADRWPIAEALVQHDDNADQNIPLMVWFGVEPLVTTDLSRAMKLAESSKLKIVQQYIARRAVDGVSKPGMDAVVSLLDRTDDQELRKWLLVGLKEGLAGLRKVEAPAMWAQTYPKLLQSARGEVREGATQIGLIFGDALALDDLRKQAADAKADPQARNRALQSLVAAKDPELASMLHKLLDDRDVRQTAIKSIAAVGHPDSAKELLKRYVRLSPFEKPDAIQTLVSRSAYAMALLEAVEKGTVDRADLSAYSIRQLANINDDGVKKKLQQVWGDVRPTDKDKQQKIKDYKKAFSTETLAKADLINGKAVYTKTCAACHVMFGEGGKVGPDLTGSQRTSIDYLLENIIDPTAQVAKEYRVTIIDTKDDRTIDGIVIAENDKSVTIRTTNEEITIPLSEIAKRRLSPLSMMPEGQLDALPEKDRIDLMGYLMK